METLLTEKEQRRQAWLRNQMKEREKEERRALARQREAFRRANSR